MKELIAQSYSEEEATRFSQYTLSDADKATICQAGIDILKHFPQHPYACAIMSALWGSLIRDKTDIPTHVVAGNLSINNKKIFYNDSSTEEVSHVFKKSNLSWDGHVWVNFAGTIGDMSLFRTAYAQPESHWLHQLVVKEFGIGRGLVFGTQSNMVYEAKYVLTDENINALISGIKTHL
jgi:hypothetical protein